jgi:hypothetical protein
LWIGETNCLSAELGEIIRLRRLIEKIQPFPDFLEG